MVEDICFFKSWLSVGFVSMLLMQAYMYKKVEFSIKYITKGFIVDSIIMTCLGYIMALILFIRTFSDFLDWLFYF